MALASLLMIFTPKYIYSTYDKINGHGLKTNGLAIAMFVFGVVLILVAVFDFLLGLCRKRCGTRVMCGTKIVHLILAVGLLVLALVSGLFIPAARRQQEDFCGAEGGGGVDSLQCLAEALLTNQRACVHSPSKLGCPKDDLVGAVVAHRKNRSTSRCITISLERERKREEGERENGEEAGGERRKEDIN